MFKTWVNKHKRLGFNFHTYHVLFSTETALQCTERLVYRSIATIVAREFYQLKREWRNMAYIHHVFAILGYLVVSDESLYSFLSRLNYSWHKICIYEYLPGGSQSFQNIIIILKLYYYINMILLIYKLGRSVTNRVIKNGITDVSLPVLEASPPTKPSLTVFDTPESF